MSNIVFVRSDDERIEVTAKSGQTVMEAALHHGINEILAECGGCMSCATCHVYVSPEWVDKLTPPDLMEESLVACAIDPNEHSRLSCQITMDDLLDGIVIHLPESQY
jgi:2Fe-2S ferredoxin